MLTRYLLRLATAWFYPLALGLLAFWLWRYPYLISTAQMVSLALFISALSLVLGLLSQGRYRLLADTPTMNLSSSAQGYAEIVGQCHLFPGEATRGILSAPPSVWYRYHAQTHWENLFGIDHGESETPFVVADHSGQCVVEPRHADILTTNRRTFTDMGKSYYYEAIFPGETLYVLGELVTEGGYNLRQDQQQAISQKLAQWKHKPGYLLRVFDRDENGEIDAEEWEQARIAAQREVEAEQLEERLCPGTHYIRAPRDGRPFIISNQNPKRLIQHYHLWSWVHLFIFAGGIIIASAL